MLIDIVAHVAHEIFNTFISVFSTVFKFTVAIFVQHFGVFLDWVGFGVNWFAVFVIANNWRVILAGQKLLS